MNATKMKVRFYGGYWLERVGVSWYAIRQGDRRRRHIGVSLAEAKRTIDAGIPALGWFSLSPDGSVGK